jgi:hypothetical protein
VAGFWPAFFGSLVVTVISMLGRALIKDQTRTHWN